MVPRLRLVWWVALVVPAFAGVAAVMPSKLQPAAAVIGVLAALVLADAVVGMQALDEISVSLPEVARLTRNQPGKIPIQFRHAGGRCLTLRVGLPLPLSLNTPIFLQEVSLPAESEHAAVDWPCTPTRRGRYALPYCCLEAASPLGFWGRRQRVPLTTELRVYPNLAVGRQRLAGFFLNRGSIGLHAQRQIGQGREFEKLRDYLPGDSFEDVHWKATAKRGRPVTKEFQLEHTQEVYVVIDASRLSDRPVADDDQTPAESVLERYVSAALILALVAQRQGDLFGLVTFSDKVTRFLRARTGKEHFAACREALYTVNSELTTPDFDELFAFLRTRLRRRALLIFLTDLADPMLAESFSRNLPMLCRHHLVLVNMFRPAGSKPLFSDPEVASVDDLYGALAGHFTWKQLRELGTVLQRYGVTLGLLDSEEMCVQLVTAYLNVKQRQQL